MRKLVLLGLLLNILTAPGCVMLPVPYPESHQETTFGNRIADEKVSFIRDGATTREEIIEKLGKPHFTLQQERIDGYIWVEKTGKVLWIGFFPPYPGGADDLRQFNTFLVAFDWDSRVVKHGTPCYLWGSLQDHARKWANKQGVILPATPKHFAREQIPSGKCILYIFRPGGTGDWLHYNPAFIIDGNYVHLRKGEYAQLVLPPGNHELHAVQELTYNIGQNGLITGTASSFNALPDSEYFIELSAPFKLTGPSDLSIHHRSENEALPVLQKLKPCGASG